MSEIDTIVLNGTEYELSGSSGGTIPAENISETEYNENVDYARNGTWEENKYLNSDGSVTTNSAYAVSDYIEMSETDVVTFQTLHSNYSLYVGCYDSSQTWISRIYSGYTTAETDLTISLAEGTSYIRITMAKSYLNDNLTNIVYINVPITYTVRDWQDTTYNRMNQLAVRTDIYSKIDDIEAILWNYRKWEGKQLVVDGNSLVDTAYWAETLASFLGMECTNLGRSGQGLVSGTNNASGQSVYPSVWTASTVISRVTDDYPSNADIIILQGDSNSTTALTDGGTVSDQMDGDDATDTWYAKMNYLIRCLKAKYPNVIIVLMPDQVRYDGAVKAHELELNSATLTTMRNVAEYNRLAFYDFEHATPFNPLHGEDAYYSLQGQVPSLGYQDYIHASGTGGQYVYGIAKGKALAGYLSQLIFDPDAPSDAVDSWEDLI